MTIAIPPEHHCGQLSTLAEVSVFTVTSTLCSGTCVVVFLVVPNRHHHPTTLARAYKYIARSIWNIRKPTVGGGYY